MMNKFRTQRSELRVFGAFGEDYAVHFLQACGYLVIANNWRYGHRELDLIMIDHNQHYHFIEVKSGGTASDPVDNFTYRKQNDFKWAVQAYLDQNNLWDNEFHGDLVAVQCKQGLVENIDYYPDVL